MLALASSISSGLVAFQLNLGNHENTLDFTAIFFGTIYSNIFVYYIIENVGIGLGFVSSYFDKEKVEVGYMYQKALGFNCFVCILITPFMYLCDKVFYALEFGIF